MGQVKYEGTEILRVLCGSRAYGLNDENSDYDYHGVYIVPTSRLLSLGVTIKETSWIEGEEQDNTAWELGHFLNLATHCNPTVLETFVAPYAQGYPTGEANALRNLFPHVLARKRIYDAFRGYAGNQRKKMFEPYGEDKDRRMAKAAIAYLRSLYHGYRLLSEGRYDTAIPKGSFRTFLIALREGPLDKGRVITLAETWERNLTAAYEASTIQLEPNLEKVNAYLLDMRKKFW